ncbi:DsbA family oxidoreductase [Micrococcoides hystricis]|uniref:DsbA family oxidoreductase n=1 Tax=Micrococcoides hystricis TaxID=1572761 RepID=A0ABV6PAB1_9MICC
MHIDVWSDIHCPWCYIGKRRLETALAKFEHADEVAVKYHSFQLDPDAPERFEGTAAEYLAQRKGADVAAIEAMFSQVATQLRDEGLEPNFSGQIIANSMKAHQLIHLAESEESAAQIIDALFRAHFEEGLDIGDVETLVLIGTKHGLDEAVIRDEFSSNTRTGAVAEDIALARQLGISGVRFFVFDMKLALSGAQPVEVFLEALRRAWHDRQRAVSETPPQSQADGRGGACGPDGCTV